jgi:segregation and condensation protein B
MDAQKLKNIVEAALLAAGRPLNAEQIQALFADHERPERGDINTAITALEADYLDRPIRIREVASGWRIQVREEMSPWLSRLWQDRPARYSRALLETLALIAYRQPITRGEIEDIRGVSVSSNIMRTLTERGWVRIVGHRDVPGRPGMYATTREFLDYFGLKKLDELPPLADIRDLDTISVELDLGLTDLPSVSSPEEAEHEETTDADVPENDRFA